MLNKRQVCPCNALQQHHILHCNLIPSQYSQENPNTELYRPQLNRFILSDSVMFTTRSYSNTMWLRTKEKVITIWSAR